MANKSGMHYTLCILVVLFTACRKNTALVDKNDSPPAQEAPATSTPPTTPPTTPADPTETGYSKIYEVGTGSGNLNIDGKSFPLTGTVLFKIKAGKYQSIQISNLDGNKGLVTIQNNGLVEMVNSEMRLQNLNNVTITGNGTTGIDKGFVFRDISNRAIEVTGALNNFTLQYVSFKNIGDYVFTYNYNDLYDGSEGSYSKNLKFLHIDCDNTSTFLAGSGSVNSGIKGYIKNLEVAYVSFKNSPDVGTIVWFGNVEDYDIHHNTVDNINTRNNNHNGIFVMNGNGKFHHNKITNHQGNSIRAFAFTLGSKPKDVSIYNNIVCNSRKYSAFEVQGFDFNVIPGVSTFANAECFNNTCGNLNLTNDWQGNVIDVYGLIGGKCAVFNNLAFNLPAPYIIAGQESNLKPIVSNNLYFSTSKEAGIIDEQSFRLNSNSPAKGKAITHVLLTTDFYNVARSSTPSIGAVE